MSKNKSKLIRVGSNFDKELKLIQNKRIELGKDNNESSRLTDMIPKHARFKEIKNDLIGYEFGMNKKGFAMLPTLLIVFIMFLALIILGVNLIIYNQVNTLLSTNVTMGAVNLADANALTFGKLNTAFINNADYFGFALIFGLIIASLLMAFILRGTSPKLFIILDILLIVVCYFIAVYLSYSYEIVINSSSIFSVYTDYMPKTSYFMLHLPSYVGIIGALVLIISYAGIPRGKSNNFIYGE